MEERFVSEDRQEGFPEPPAILDLNNTYGPFPGTQDWGKSSVAGAAHSGIIGKRVLVAGGVTAVCEAGGLVMAVLPG